MENKIVFGEEEAKVRNMKEAAPGQVLGVVPAQYERKFVVMRSYDPGRPGIYIDLLDKNGDFLPLTYIEDIADDDELGYHGVHAMFGSEIWTDEYDKDGVIPHSDIERAEAECAAEAVKSV